MSLSMLDVVQHFARIISPRRVPREPPCTTLKRGQVLSPGRQALPFDNSDGFIKSRTVDTPADHWCLSACIPHEVEKESWHILEAAVCVHLRPAAHAEPVRYAATLPRVGLMDRCLLHVWLKIASVGWRVE